MEQTNRVRLSKDERRQQIVESAKLVFVKKGYSATTTASIAKQAEIAEVTLFRYFDSKKDIFNAVIDPIMQRQTRNLPKEVMSMKKDKILENILLDRIMYLSKNQGVIKLILNESLLNQEENYVGNMVKGLTQLLKQANIELDNPFAIRILMGSFLSFLYFPEQDKNRLKKYVDDIVKVLMQ
jgi:AcrR family transcriptional regulator